LRRDLDGFSHDRDSFQREMLASKVTIVTPLKEKHQNHQFSYNLAHSY
jgi:hypothetical protein